MDYMTNLTVRLGQGQGQIQLSQCSTLVVFTHPSNPHAPRSRHTFETFVGSSRHSAEIVAQWEVRRLVKQSLVA